MKVRLLSDAEAEALDRLAFTTTGRADRIARIEQAALIAQCGGVEDRTLEVLLHLGIAGQMTPTVARRLREVGIDMRPWEGP